MAQRRRQYPFDEIEPRWQERWASEGVFGAPNPGDPTFDPARPKFYILDMFPYPSGDGLHVGHTEGYTATDILSRLMRMRGCNVLHPMGWDAFGLPAEQYAIRTGQHPRVTTERNIGRFRAQLRRMGFSYDWAREINTTDPAYFRWTQWIFRLLYESWFDPERQCARPIAELETRQAAQRPDEPPAERRAFIDAHRLAYVAEMPVNWCPELGTVLANEEVVDGKSEVGGFPVERRPMRQWMLRITAYARRLLDELDGLDWPESIKMLQRNWIGRSEGAEVHFHIADDCTGAPGATLTVFTTRPDTLFGATYMVLAPEHPLVDRITTPDQRDAVARYRAAVAAKTDLERTDLAREKSGVFTGGHAINPVNEERIPIWIADYVLMSYGTGAIMAVPAHDERDWEFATMFNLPIRTVVLADRIEERAGCFAGEGTAINSPTIDGLRTPDAKRVIIAWLDQRGLGAPAVNYRLRDWLFSRQRYWGEPFPIVWTDAGHASVPESELPVLPPDLDDFKPTGTAEPPLARVRAWTRHPSGAMRETNTMPQWAGSCWYYLRFCDPTNAAAFAGREAERYWMGGGRPGGVDLYVGGTEHAVLHLLYARFWHKVLFDLGHVSTPEPFQRLVNQGIILGEDGQKMAKSRGNVVNPDRVIDDYGADSLRLYEMFMGPLEQMKPWSTRGVEGVHRFLARVWRLVMEDAPGEGWQIAASVVDEPPAPDLLRALHTTIRKVSLDLDALAFNTAISQMMILTNDLTAAEHKPVPILRLFLPLLSPFAPHIAEELWAQLGRRFAGFDGFACQQPWPAWDETILACARVEIVLQIDGKVRDRLDAPRDATREEVERLALDHPRVREALGDRTPTRIVVVPNRLVNVVR